MSHLQALAIRLTVLGLTFATLAPLPGQAQGCNGQGATTYGYDFDSGPGGWTQDGTGGGWSIVADRFHSSHASLFAADLGEPIDRRAYSPVVTLQPGTNFLRFWHWQEIESAPNNPPHACYDGAVVEVGILGSGTWHRLDTEIVNTPYDGPIHTDTGSVLAGEGAWCGDSRDWHETVVDLSTFSGHQVEVRFRLVTDNDTGREGWYIDDVAIENCQGIFIDGFENGTTERWSGAVGSSVPSSTSRRLGTVRRCEAISYEKDPAASAARPRHSEDPPMEVDVTAPATC